MNEDFIGIGWAHPMQTDDTGGVALVRRDEEIRQAVRLILGTAPGERPMRPEFGCQIHDRVFAPINSATASQIAMDVREALDRWEPRIEVQDVIVNFDQSDEGKVLVEVGYVIVGLNDPRNLVFPFYMIPDERAVPLAQPVPIKAGA